MMKKIFYILCSFSFLFYSCTSIGNKMDKAESLLPNAPDSALHLLEFLLPEYDNMPDNEKARFGILYFSALDKNDLELEPVEMIDYSIEYCSAKAKADYTAHACLYKARYFIYRNQLKEATALLFDALKVVPRNNYILSGKIYSDLGNICYYQDAYKKAISYYENALEYFERAEDFDNIAVIMVGMGDIYRRLGDNKMSLHFFDRSLLVVSDSITLGDIYYQLFQNFLENENRDSALYYMRKSLTYPTIEPNLSLKLFSLSDFYFLENQYDSAELYADMSLKHPSNIYIKKECYRLLRDIAIAKNNEKDINRYLYLYDVAIDSILKIESQPDIEVSENLHYAKLEKTKIKNTNYLLVGILVLIIMILFVFYFRMKENQSEEQKKERRRRELLQRRSRLIHKIEIEKNNLKYPSRSFGVKERESEIRSIYEKDLHISDLQTMFALMNSLFDNIPSELQEEYPKVNEKELLYICLLMLETPLEDMYLLLDYKPESLKKMRYRLAPKFSLESATDLNDFISRYFGLY